MRGAAPGQRADRVGGAGKNTAASPWIFWQKLHKNANLAALFHQNLPKPILLERIKNIYRDML
jgi:hypothetical protein